MRTITASHVRTALRCLAIPLLIGTAGACGSGSDSSDSGSSTHPRPASAGPVSTAEVREQVRQFSMGGGIKDAAEERFYDWGEAAEPGLVELARDPSVSPDDLDCMVMIAALYVHTPAVFDALRTRIASLPDDQDRAVRLKVLDALRLQAGVPRPRV